MTIEERGAPTGPRSLRCLGLLLCLTGCQHAPQVVWRLDESSSFGKQYLAAYNSNRGGGLIAFTLLMEATSDVPSDATIFDCDGFHEEKRVPVHKEKGLAIQRGDTLHVSCVGAPNTYYLISVSR